MSAFIKHLRLHYQFFILSGPFLLGGLFSPRIGLLYFFIQFLSIHIFLFGGVTAYNSYWDKDEGPIGGLKHPPKMKRWMLSASWVFQFIGFLIAFMSGLLFALVYLVSVLFFWLYSSPSFRWKGRPTLSFVAIGIATILCPFFLGYISFGGVSFNFNLVLTSVGAMCLVLSMYPFSQLYQIKTDKKRGDMTFAGRYGMSGVKDSFLLLFPFGLLLLSYALLELSHFAGVTFLLVGSMVGIYVFRVLQKMSPDEREYERVMKLKYISGLTFSLSVLVYLLIA